MLNFRFGGLVLMVYARRRLAGGESGRSAGGRRDDALAAAAYLSTSPQIREQNRFTSARSSKWPCCLPGLVTMVPALQILNAGQRLGVSSPASFSGWRSGFQVFSTTLRPM
jgi:hypothetical protein